MNEQCTHGTLVYDMVLRSENPPRKRIEWCGTCGVLLSYDGRNVEATEARLRDALENTKALLVRADSMLSYIRHRGPQGWEQKGLHDLSANEVDQLIGELRKASSSA